MLHGAAGADAGQVNHFALDAGKEDSRFNRRDGAVIKCSRERAIGERFPGSHHVGRSRFFLRAYRVFVALSGLVPSAIDANDPGFCHGFLRRRITPDTADRISNYGRDVWEKIHSGSLECERAPSSAVAVFVQKVLPRKLCSVIVARIRLVYCKWLDSFYVGDSPMLERDTRPATHHKPCG